MRAIKEAHSHRMIIVGNANRPGNPYGKMRHAFRGASFEWSDYLIVGIWRFHYDRILLEDTLSLQTKICQLVLMPFHLLLLNRYENDLIYSCVSHLSRTSFPKIRTPRRPALPFQSAHGLKTVHIIERSKNENLSPVRNFFAFFSMRRSDGGKSGGGHIVRFPSIYFFSIFQKNG